MPAFHVLHYKNFRLVILGDTNLQNWSQRAANLEHICILVTCKDPYPKGQPYVLALFLPCIPYKKESLDKNGESGRA